MKVKNVRNLSRDLTGNLVVEGKRETAQNSQSFERHFNNLGQMEYERYVKELAEKINLQGQMLVKRADLGEMQKYRELIGELINEAVSNAYTFRKENVFDLKGRMKVYATVSKINRKLEELAQEVLKENKDNLAIMNTVDEIRGLIIDVFL